MWQRLICCCAQNGPHPRRDPGRITSQAGNKRVKAAPEEEQLGTARGSAQDIKNIDGAGGQAFDRPLGFGPASRQQFWTGRARRGARKPLKKLRRRPFSYDDVRQTSVLGIANSSLQELNKRGAARRQLVLPGPNPLLQAPACTARSEFFTTAASLYYQVRILHYS